MAFYSIQERLNLHECYIRNNKSPSLALREYRLLYPARRVPTKHIFSRIVRDLERGVVVNKEKRRRKTVLTEEKQLEVLLYFEENAENSQRDASRDLPGITKTSIQRTLTINNYHPFKFLPVQELSQQDTQARLFYCSVMMDHYFENDIFKNILFTDEAIFNTAGMYNRKNTHYWSNSNEHRVKEIKKQGWRSVYVWCGIIRDRIIGPVFYDVTLNGERYLNLLENDISRLIDNLPENVKEDIIFQQDNAPYHTVVAVRNYLNQRFPFWIGRYGTIDWPARSPDLTPLDFFLWGCLKNEVYKNRCNGVLDLKRRIRQEVERLNGTDAVRNAIAKIGTIYTTCIAKNGGYVEDIL